MTPSDWWVSVAVMLNWTVFPWACKSQLTGLGKPDHLTRVELDPCGARRGAYLAKLMSLLLRHGWQARASTRIHTNSTPEQVADGTVTPPPVHHCCTEASRITPPISRSLGRHDPLPHSFFPAASFSHQPHERTEASTWDDPPPLYALLPNR